MAGDLGAPQATSDYDPYRSFKFRLIWDGKYVAGFTDVSGLTLSVKTTLQRSGGDKNLRRKIPGQNNYEAITLERGVTHDVAFEHWANKVWDYQNSSVDKASIDFRKDMTLEVFNEAGQKVLAYNIYRCWPSEFIALAELDGNANSVAIQSITLQNEGWERDKSVKASR